MLFWIFIIALLVGVLCIIAYLWMFNNTKYDPEWLSYTGIAIVIFAGLAVIISLVVMVVNFVGTDAEVARNHERYEALVYQLENNLYDNDNDIGKKSLYNEVREWNEDLSYYQNIQDDFWIGIYYPNVFDQFEFIDYGKGE